MYKCIIYLNIIYIMHLYVYVAFIIKCNAYFHYGFIHSPMNACPHDGIQVVSNLSCAPDHVLPILWPAKSVHSTVSGRFSGTLATTVPRSDWEMAD